MTFLLKFHQSRVSRKKRVRNSASQAECSGATPVQRTAPRERAPRKDALKTERLKQS